MSLFRKNKKKRVWPLFLLIFFVLLVGGGFLILNWVKTLSPTDLLESNVVKNYISEHADQKEVELFSLLTEMIGGEEEVKNYLILFANNTEMRPGGGFLGSYAVVQVRGGNITIVKVEGTEVIDKGTPDSWRPVPPAPLTEHLGVDRWYFRDSNWSPDFSESSKKALELYKGEQGLLADNIDAVIAITTTVLEEVLKVVGPVTVQDIKFTHENVIEKLEYEVEYGYYDRGIADIDRKQIMKEISDALLTKIKDTILQNIDNYREMVQKLIVEKHVLAYSQNRILQENFKNLGLSGEMFTGEGDYLLWVDANLAALKTDHALNRTLNYSFTKNDDGEYVASASMKYEHTGEFDWRTSRYRTYSRVFVPLGSEFVSVEGAMRTDRSNEPGTVDIGIDMDRQWFGTFIAIEPGKVGTLTFSYVLPDSITRLIENGSYALFVQKQLGLVESGLTLELNFDTNIKSAYPGEEKVDWGDSLYHLSTDLRIDKEFEVNLR